MKRIIAILLAVCTVFALAACGAQQETAQTEQTEQTAEPSVELTPAEATIADIIAATTIPEGETYDLDAKLPLVQPGEDNKLSIGIIVSANTTDYKDNDMTRWVEEKTGVELEFVQFAGSSSDAATQISLMMAAGEKLPDILLWFGGISKTQSTLYGKDGYFADLSPYFRDPDMNYYRRWGLDYNFNYDPDANRVLMLREIDSTTGAMYQYPLITNEPEDRPKNHVHINKLWLEKLGLEMPRTLDELYDVLVAFRDQDPNGNGKKDEIPLIGRITSYRDVVQWILNAFVYVNDSYYFNITDGEFWVPYDTDEYRQALIYVKKLVDEGLLSTQTWTMNAEELRSVINPTDGVYTAGIVGANIYSDMPASSHAMQDYIQVPPLKDYTGKGGYGPQTSYMMSYSTFITADCEKPELAFRLLDFLSGPEAWLHMRWGVKDRDWEYIDESLGETGSLGGTATVRLLTDKDPQTYANNITWNAYVGVSSSLIDQKVVDLSDPDAYTTARYYHDTDIIRYYAEAGMPDEVFYYNVYTDEETERRSEFVSDLTKYITSARAEFCNGIRDPESDADWSAYLADLDGLGKDEWLEIAATAYARTFGNH